MKTLKKKVVEGLLLSLISTLVIVLLLEMFFSVFEKDKDMPAVLMAQIDYFRSGKNSDFPYLSYELVPNATEGQVKINSLGFRDIEREINKKNEKKRVCVIGDSITFGIGVKFNETYPYILEKMLRSGGFEAEIWNMGVPAYNSIQKNIMVKRCIDEFHGDIIIYQYFVDDSWPTAILFDPENKNKIIEDVFINTTKREAISRFMEPILPLPRNINSFLIEESSFFRFVNIRAYNVLSRIYPSRYPADAYNNYKRDTAYINNFAYLNNSFETIFESGVKLIIFTPTALKQDYIEPFEGKEIIQSNSGRFNFTFLDFKDELYRKNITDFRIFLRPDNPNDDTHPNPYGQQVYAEILYEYLVKII